MKILLIIPNLSDLDLMSWRQRYLLVHSIIYYDMNNNVISDKKWDQSARILIKQMEDKFLARKSEYWKYFYDFDGSTGFDLVERLREQDPEHFSYLSRIASHVIMNSSKVS